MDKISLIKSIHELYDEIDDAIGMIVKSRVEQDAVSEGKAISKMETLMVECQQELDVISDYLNEHDC